ncbi:MAG: cyclic nucleotide-binding domain-containing protein [Desulfobacteraceae bacterium]|jgi:CRP-like cAMP-binding protein
MQESKFLEKNESMLNNLKSIDMLQPFEDQEIYKLLEMSKVRKYKAGEHILKQGQSETWLYILLSGQVKISKNGKDVALLENKGEIFGEMGAMDCSRRSASAYAVTNTVCLATDMFYIENLTGNEKTAFGYVLYRLLAEILSSRLRQTTNAMIKSKGRLNLKFW